MASVSSANLDAAGKLNEAKGCTIDQIKAEGGRLEFDRLDQRLPFPLPDDGVAALRLDPTILELSQYTLKVTGLKDASSYALKLNGVPVLVAPGKNVRGGREPHGPGHAGRVEASQSRRGPIAGDPGSRGGQGSVGQPVAESFAEGPCRTCVRGAEGATGRRGQKGGRGRREDPRSRPAAEMCIARFRRRRKSDTYASIPSERSR